MRKRYMLPLASAFLAMWACGGEDDGSTVAQPQDTMELSVPGLLLELYSGDGAPSVPATDIESPQLLQKNAVSATANFSKCL